MPELLWPENDRAWFSCRAAAARLKARAPCENLGSRSLRAPALFRANVQQRFSGSDVMPVLVRLLAERPGEQLLALFTVPGADVPRANLRLAGVVLRIGRDHLLKQLVGP